MSGAKPKSVQRYRICGTPSRLGCLTCKIRRVKCGEEKPFCKRCTSTGRKCDGYGPPPVPKSPRPSSSLSAQKGRSISRSPSASTSRISLVPPQDPLESELLEFFKSTTVKSLSANFWPAFWQERVLQATSVEPSILHAVIAIAAVHRDLELKSTGQNDGNLQPFAFKQYTMAISHLHRLMSGGTQHLDVTLISCILFICFDFLVSNHSSAIIHLNAGLKILEGLQTFNQNLVHKWKLEFAPILLTLGVQAAAFTNPQIPAERYALWNSLKTLTVFNKTGKFSNLEEARHALDSIAAEMMAAREMLYITSNERYLASLSLWTEQMNVYLASLQQQQNTDINIRRGAAILRVYYLLLFSTVNPSQPRYEELLALCENLILNNPDARQAFTITHDIISPLFLTALGTSDAYVQAKAVDLLKLRRGREGVWDRDDTLSILRLLVANEEMPILRLGTEAYGESSQQQQQQQQRSADGRRWDESALERNRRIWKEVQGALQNGMIWVGEESPVQEGEIEVGRWEGVDFEMGLGLGDGLMGMGLGMGIGTASASGSGSGPAPGTGGGLSPGLQRGNVNTSPLSGSVDESYAPWSSG